MEVGGGGGRWGLEEISANNTFFVVPQIFGIGQAQPSNLYRMHLFRIAVRNYLSSVH